ncbi:hypothetical protein [Marinovum sp.]|uniref:hypothetical protein n=1 Tax=Marinovum sp. TaxID=2024839 RepID=UPI002B26F92A|nr:hypothetical protein [Marinovum sp.]
MLALAGSGLAAQAAGEPAPAPRPSDEEIIAEVDAGLDLLRAGETEAARLRLEAVNNITYAADYPPVVDHYPNLGLSQYHYETGDWPEVLRFSASVATGLIAEGLADHPHRVTASVLQGAALARLSRQTEAEVLLRNGVAAARGRPELAETYGVALYNLALLVTDLDREDHGAITDEFLDNWSSDWPIPLQLSLIISYRDIDNDYTVDDDLARAIRRARNLVAAAESAEDVPLRRVAGFRGYLGLLLAQDGDFATALDLLQKEYDYYREARVTGSDLTNCIIYLGLVIRYGQSAEAALSFFADEVQIARQSGTGAHDIARFLMEQAAAAEATGAQDESQRLYREAYAELRSVDRANHWVAQQARAQIDIDHPGMAGFAFASELGAVEAVRFDLTADGRDVLRLFFEGNYLLLDPVLARHAGAEGREAVLYRLNRALALALMGRHDESLAVLDETRARAIATGALPPGAPILDLIETVARVWGSGHDPEAAAGALARLKARAPAMNAEVRSAYRALLAFYHFRRDDRRRMTEVLAVWFADRPPGPATSLWEIYAATLVMEMAFGQMDPALNEALMQETLAALEAYPTLTLSRDYLRVVKVMNSRTGVFNDEALVELGTVVSSVGAMVPEGHSLHYATQFALSNVHAWRGKTEEALYWLRQSVETMRATRYHRQDEVAFLLSRQAGLLLGLGRINEAHSLSQEALRLIDPLTDRPNLIGEIYQTTASALWWRSDDPQKAADFIDGVLGDPKILSRLEPVDRVILLRLKADAEANFAALDAVLATLDRAEAQIGLDPVIDWRREQSFNRQTRAIANYWNGALAEGFAAIVESNDIYTAWLASIRRAEGAQGVDPGAYRDRAVWEAMIGWDYARSLPE